MRRVSVIEVRNLTKYYGSLAAIQDVTFTVQPGEIMGFLGPNAAGKTTTMRILTGFMPPTSGTARVAGFDVVEQSLEARRAIGYMPESVPLYPEMTVRDYLGFFAALRKVPKARQRIDTVIAMTNLEEFASIEIAKLSKGTRQRVGLAQAILHDPQVLILDEPTVGLDPKQITEVRQLIKSLGGRHTIILSTHILPEVSQVCQRVLIIHQGRLIAEDTPENLTARLQGADRLYIEVRRPSPELSQRLLKVSGVQTVEEKGPGRYEVTCTKDSDRREEIAQAVIQGGWGLLELRRVGMSLEEIFLKLTTEEAKI
jgi:ABC-2 type transport system ATP-binding protein